MKKPAFIIGKKQIIMACLTLILGIAVYVNYVIAGGASLANKPSGNLTDDDTYGDTQFVNAGEEDLSNLENVNAEEFFAQARIDKAASNDKAIQTLQTCLGGGDITKEEAVVKALESVNLSKMTELEDRLESLIKALGYADCLVYLDENDAKIVVQTDGLDVGKAAAIKDIVLSEISISPQNIRIYEVK
ncbi:MAG: SpoIIIAH-like family protein [Oscillospiraceae bacterium]|nr:SpoIIIAH-like family protein [Oscillospiraceae bacterium]